MVDLFGEEPAPEPVVTEEISTPPPQQQGEALSLLGHHEILQDIQTLLDQGRMPHGIVLYGKEGIGKHLLALHIAALLMGKDKLHRMAQGGHPDMLMLGRETDERKGQLKKDLPVSVIRKIPGFIRQTAAEGGWRAVIINDADCMNRNAQNALLKSLEEPPRNTCLILVVHQFGRLIPTIRSRVWAVPVSPLSLRDVETIMRDKLEITPTALALALSQGSVALAAQISDEKISDDVHALVTLLPNMTQANPVEREQICQSMAASDNPQVPLSILLRMIEADILGLLPDPGLAPEASHAWTAWKHATPLAQRLKIRDKLSEAMRIAETAYLDRLALADMVVSTLEKQRA